MKGNKKMKFNIRMIPYILINLIGFYLLPLLIKDTGSGMLILLIAIPLICFLTSTFFGIKNSFNWIYCLCFTLLFIPTVFIYYNESAIFYSAVYAIITIIGNFIGKMIYNKK